MKPVHLVDGPLRGHWMEVPEDWEYVEVPVPASCVTILREPGLPPRVMSRTPRRAFYSQNPDLIPGLWSLVAVRVPLG